MDDQLKPCPLCNEPGWLCKEGHPIIFCSNIMCELYNFGITEKAWQSLPRRNESANALADDIDKAWRGERDMPLGYSVMFETFVERVRQLGRSYNY